MELKGKLVIIGGAEDKGTAEDQNDFTHHGILKRIVEECRKKNKSRIEILTTASGTPEDSGGDYVEAFRKLDCSDIGVFLITERDQAEEEENIKRLQQADLVFATGGDQLRLTSVLGGTTFFKTLVQKLETDKKFIYAGTSAGAAAVSENMLFEGNSTDALLKGEVKSTSGFGFIRNVVFDTHFIHRGRIGRLFQILITNPKLLGVGLEENTGLLICDKKMEAIGPGMGIIIDARTVKNTNLLEARDGTPLSIEGLTLHVISKSDIYDLQTGELKIITPEDCQA